MKYGRYLISVLATGGLALVLYGCDKPEGPAEQAGKKVDKAVEQVGQQIEKAGEKIQEEAKGAKKDSAP